MGERDKREKKKTKQEGISGKRERDQEDERWAGVSYDDEAVPRERRNSKVKIPESWPSLKRIE